MGNVTTQLVINLFGGGAEAPPYTAICSFVGMAFFPSVCCLFGNSDRLLNNYKQITSNAKN